MKLDIGGYYLRSFEDSDVEALVKHGNNKKVSVNLRDGFPYPYTISDAHNWILYNKQKFPETNFAIADKNELIGGIGIAIQDDVHRLCAEIGYWLSESYWGKGIATKALKTMTEYALRNFDLIRIYANVFQTNTASIKVLEKAGYILEGRLRKSVIKDGKILDQFIYAYLK